MSVYLAKHGRLNIEFTAVAKCFANDNRVWATMARVQVDFSMSSNPSVRRNGGIGKAGENAGSVKQANLWRLHQKNKITGWASRCLMCRARSLDLRGEEICNRRFGTYLHQAEDQWIVKDMGQIGCVYFSFLFFVR
jgi:hypothetical protein